MPENTSRWVHRGLALACFVASVGLAASSALAGNATPAHHLSMEHLNPQGARFLNYDGSENLDRHHRDFPITLIFYRNASISKVRDAVGYPNSGSGEYDAYQLTPTAHKHFHKDGGRKTDCGDHSPSGRDTHYRLYAAGGSTQRLFDPNWGYYVVASTHYDNGDGCAGKRWFGYSERAETFISSQMATNGYQVNQDYFQTHNREDLRTDTSEGNHYWENDGLATAVRIP